MLQPRERPETNSGISGLEFGRAVKGPRIFQSSADVVLLAPLGTLLCEVPTGDRSSDIVLGDVVRERIDCVSQVDSVSVSVVLGVAAEVVNRESGTRRRPTNGHRHVFPKSRPIFHGPR